MSHIDREMSLTSTADIELAKVAERYIVNALNNSQAKNIEAMGDGSGRSDAGSLLRLPPKVLRLFADMLGSLAQGKAIAIMPKEIDVTTQEAALFLNVSRPYLVRLLEAGKIPYHKVGTHRRIRLEDVIRYKEERHRVSREALQKLVDQAQELDMGY